MCPTKHGDGRFQVQTISYGLGTHLPRWVHGMQLENMSKNSTVNFQAESKKSGNDFEDMVLKDLSDRGFQNIRQNVFMPGTGCEVDFLADNKEYIEAKGGYSGDGKRPGAKRTDNVKKAVANAALIKIHYPNIYFVAYFSSKPKKGGSSDQMIQTALDGKLFDEVRYIYMNEKITEDDFLPFEELYGIE